MKKNLLISFKLTLVMIILCAVLYPLLIAGVGKMTPGGGKGETVSVNGKVVGYEKIGQKFTDNKYFWDALLLLITMQPVLQAPIRDLPIPDYLQVVKDRIDSFLVYNPGIKKEDIPAEMVTASGSGLDPDISPQGAYIQVKRIATVRGLREEKVKALVDQQIEKPLAGMLGPSKVNVLKLNIELDNLK